VTKTLSLCQTKKKRAFAAFDATQPNKRSTISDASDRPLRQLPLNIRAKKTRWGNVDIDQDLDADSFTTNSQKNHAFTNCLAAQDVNKENSYNWQLFKSELPCTKLTLYTAINCSPNKIIMKGSKKSLSNKPASPPTGESKKWKRFRIPKSSKWLEVPETEEEDYQGDEYSTE